MSNAYLGHANDRQDSGPSCAVLLVNLGTPSAPNKTATRRYLAEFLRDPRVIELPRAVWLPVLYGVILPFRSGRSAEAYRSIWMPEGSPLRVHSERLAVGLDRAFATAGLPVSVRLAMRYGEPSIPSSLRQLHDEGLRRLIVLPLYPQYSATTTASVFDAVADELRGWRRVPELRTIADYWHEPAWLEAIADSIRRHWQAQPRGERLLFSFHGLPRRYVDAGDPYFDQCQSTARAIAARLGLADSDWQLSFQSRVGREEWLRPYTDDAVRALAASGVKRLDVICPGFAVDCLETLEEIEMQNATSFVAAGGERLSYIPALNADAAHIDALAALVRRHGPGWPEFEPTIDVDIDRQAPSARARRDDGFRDE